MITRTAKSENEFIHTLESHIQRHNRAHLVSRCCLCHFTTIWPHCHNRSSQAFMKASSCESTTEALYPPIHFPANQILPDHQVQNAEESQIHSERISNSQDRTARCRCVQKRREWTSVGRWRPGNFPVGYGLPGGREGKWR